MRFGMPALVECATLEDCARLASSLGLSFIEINLCFPQYQPEVLSVSHLAALRETYGVDYTFHTDDQFNPFDVNHRVSKANLETMLDLISICSSLEIPRINMHLLHGVYVTLPGKRIFMNDVYLDDYLRKVADFRDACEKAAGSSHLRITVENMENGFLPSNLKAIDVLLESPLFGLTLDTGHEFVAQNMDLPLYEARGDRLCHMHLHDALLPNTPHLPLGEGHADIPGKILQAQKADASCVLEVKTIEGLKKSVAYLKKNGYM